MGVPRDHHFFMTVSFNGITNLMRCYVYEWPDFPKCSFGFTEDQFVLCVLSSSLKTNFYPRCSFGFTEDQMYSYRITRLCVFGNASV